MSKIAVRIYQADDGVIRDMTDEYGVDNLAGQVPMVGDYIINSFMERGKDRNDPTNYGLLKVVARYFRPKGNDDYVAIVVENQQAGREHIELVL